jgi:pyridoxine 5-phosphate synthase
MARLGVNVDHVATVREARKTYEPDPVWAAVQAELGGAHGITVHLRGDRRHIQERDVRLMRQIVQTQLNIEMAVTEEAIRFACSLLPHQATLVPERTEEVTTEGGLNVEANQEAIARCIRTLRSEGIRTSLFVDPSPRAIELAQEMRADAIEIHTGRYAAARDEEDRKYALEELTQAAELSGRLGLATYAGHGLTYRNVVPVARIPEVEELNIGHSIISRAVFVGIERAVREMVDLIVDL